MVFHLFVSEEIHYKFNAPDAGSYSHMELRVINNSRMRFAFTQPAWMQDQKVLIGGQYDKAFFSSVGKLFPVGLTRHSGIDNGRYEGSPLAQAADNPVVDIFVRVEPDHGF